MKFDENGEGLREYIQYYAISDENAGTMRTYIVRDNYSSELVGYFSLKAGLISMNEHEEEIPDSETGSSTTVTKQKLYKNKRTGYARAFAF